MRKLCVLLLCTALGCTGVQSALARDWLERTMPIDDHRTARAGGALAVGTATVASGYFATDLWGTNTVDLDVRYLLHGYQTIVWSDGRPWLNGTVIKHAMAQPAPDGAQVFTLEIAEGLMYNDGTPVTAADYAFSMLLEASPAAEALGGACRNMGYIPGFDAYHTGEKALFAGVYLISPTAFALEIAEEVLADFYGPELLAITPYPISVIAPGYEVRDDGAGVYLVSGGAPSGLTTELLAKTLLAASEGYARNPRVTSGPYMLDDYDTDEGRVTFTANPRFAGDAWGFRPAIEHLTMLWVDEHDAARMLAAHEIDLMNKAFGPDALTQLRSLDGISETAYPRTGLAFLAFATERDPVSDPAVRRAVAMAVDRDAFVIGHPGLERVYGYYGPGQWMAEMVLENAPGLLRALDIPLDPDGANQLLDTTGWNATQSGSRQRYDADTGKALRLVLARSAHSSLADDVEAMLREGLAGIGAELQVENLAFDSLLAQYYHQQERTADIYYLASEFPADFDPLDVFKEEEGLPDYHAPTSVRDDELIADSEAMLYAGFEDRADYITAWLAFQRRFMQVLPMIPLYSGTYHDFFTSALMDYDVATYGSWAAAIVSAYLDQ